VLEVTLKATPKGCWVSDLLERHPDVQVKVVDCKKISGKSTGVHHLFEILVPPQKTQYLVESIEKDPAIYDPEIIASKTGRIYGSIKIRNHSCLFTRTPGIHLKSANTTLDRFVLWNILSDSRAFHQLMKGLDSDGVGVEVVRRRQFDGKTIVTAKQNLILKTALERGYFEYPRRIRLEEMAQISGTTPSAMTQILRKGIKRILLEFFDSSQV